MIGLLPQLAPSLWTALFFLLAGHALADYSLQSDSMARGKNRNSVLAPGLVSKYAPRWFHWMAAHALIHGMVVGLIIDPVFGVIETVLHFCIDCGKCDDMYGINVDQTLHIGCKVGYILALVSMVS